MAAWICIFGCSGSGYFMILTVLGRRFRRRFLVVIATPWARMIIWLA